MNKLTRSDLLSLEDYAEQRAVFRQHVMEHKKQRHLSLGKHARLLFEDKMTIQYQIQEMLRIERIFDPEGIQDELDTYNPLIPDGQNLKATLMLEYAEPTERKHALASLIGVEQTVWVQIGQHAKVYPICNEDLERSNEEKTASVNFLRLNLSDDMCSALREGEKLQAGIDNHHLETNVLVAEPIRKALSQDVILC